MSQSVEQITLTAPDISCGHCVATIEREVGALEGVQRVRADRETKRVEVAYDPIRVSAVQIAATLDEAGYPVQE